jgi:hypothetical protein
VADLTDAHVGTEEADLTPEGRNELRPSRRGEGEQDQLSGRSGPPSDVDRIETEEQGRLGESVEQIGAWKPAPTEPDVGAGFQLATASGPNPNLPPPPHPHPLIRQPRLVPTPTCPLNLIANPKPLTALPLLHR